MIVRQSAKGTAWDDHCPQSELSYAVRATWSSTSDPDCESLCTYYVYCHQVIDKSQATQKQTYNKDDSSSCSQKKKIRFKNHLQTILNNYRNVKKTKQKCISNFKSKCVFGILHFLSLSSFSLVFHSLNPLPLTVLFLFGLVSLACLSYLATAPVQNPAGDYSGCNLNLQAKWKKFRLFVFCKLPPQTVLESLIVVCRGLMRRLHYILVYEGGGCF